MTGRVVLLLFGVDLAYFLRWYCQLFAGMMCATGLVC